MKKLRLSDIAAHLTPIAVVLKGGSFEASEDALEAMLEGSAEVQDYKHFVEYAVDSSTEPDADQKFRFRFQYDIGIRLINKTDDEENQIKVLIQAKFEAQYTSDSDFDNEALNLFGGINAEYHIWPYWREYVQNVCQRAGLPPISIGLNKGFMTATEKDVAKQEHLEEVETA